MFTKSKPPTGSPSGVSSKPSRQGPPSIIAVDMRILGDLETDGDVQIDGQVDGNLRTKSVTIGKDATINGSITGETIHVSGTVNGQISGKNVVLASTAKVVGDILHDSLSIEAGAFLEGLCKRMADDVPSSVVSAVPLKEAKAS